MSIIEMDEKRVPMMRMYLSMALPVVLSMVTAMVYNIADTWFISATGITGLIAGVSLNAPVLTILMAFGNIFGQGGSTLISRLTGQKNTADAMRVSSACFYLSIAAGLIAGIVMLIFKAQFMQILGADPETMEYASAYYTWLAVGAVFIVTSFIPTNLLRAEGLSKEAMFESIGGTVLNIILDPVFIFVFDLGAAGAAMATVLGYVFMDVYGVIIINKKSRLLSVSLKKAKTTRGNLGQIFGTGIPAAITNVMTSVSTVFLNRFLLPYGNDMIAAMGIALKVTLIGQLILVGLTFGALPLFGYYYGGNRTEKFMELFRFCLRFVCITALALTAVLFAASKLLISFFVDDSSLISAGTLMLRLQVIALVFAGIVLLLTIVFQSMGKIKEMFLLSVSRQGVVFLIVLFVASRIGGYYGIIAAQAIADVLSAALAAAMFIHVKRTCLRPSVGEIPEMPKKPRASGQNKTTQKLSQSRC